MPHENYARLLAELAQAYTLRSPSSATLNQQAEQYLVDGGSHALRLIRPFPPRIVSSQGAWLVDADGHKILDFWQGHYANLLGHNPPEITGCLAEAFHRDYGLQNGHTDQLQIETAELMCRLTGAERVRFTTSGTLATMYAIMLARAFTGRRLVMKTGGGWHGGQPWALYGVGYSQADGYQHADSAGLPGNMAAEVLITRFNDSQLLQDQFRRYGDQLACLILELVPGTAGGMAATAQYAQAARQLTEAHGAVLIVDEVITGFRLRAGPVASFYGLQADLATFGKVMGGGMPVAAVAGRADIMNLAGRAGGERVKFSGGTYSSHPASLLAARAMLSYLAAHEAEVYPCLSALGDRARHVIQAAFAGHDIYAAPTGGAAGPLPASSFIHVHFPYEAGREVTAPDEANDPAICDVALKEKVVPLAMLLHDVYVRHGLGSVSTAHSEADLDRLGEAYEAVATRIQEYQDSSARSELASLAP